MKVLFQALRIVGALNSNRTKEPKLGLIASAD